MEQPRIIATNLAEGLTRLTDSLRARTRILAHAVKIMRGEAERLAAHIRQHADHLGKRRSRDNLVYSFGSIAEREGYLDLDDYAVAGLEHHGQLYAYWLALAARETLASNRGALLRHIFSCPIRLDFCTKEGARLAHEYWRVAQELDTALFNRRQEAGSKHWRKDPMTARQYFRISLICRRGGFADPGPMKSGPAHDWIVAHGSHPDFWEAPEVAPPWILDDSNDGWGRPASE